MQNAKSLVLASLLSISGLVLASCGPCCSEKGCPVETKEVVRTEEVKTMPSEDSSAMHVDAPAAEEVVVEDKE